MTNQSAGHTPHSWLSRTWNPGSHLPLGLLQPLTDSNYFHVQCSVCKKSMYSYPTERKVCFLGHAGSYTPGKMRVTGRILLCRAKY